jgi:hypothetical protein
MPQEICHNKWQCLSHLQVASSGHVIHLNKKVKLISATFCEALNSVQCGTWNLFGNFWLYTYHEYYSWNYAFSSSTYYKTLWWQIFKYVHILKSVSVFISPSIQTLICTKFVTIKGNFPYPCHNVPTTTTDISNNQQNSTQIGHVMKLSITWCSQVQMLIFDSVEINGMAELPCAWQDLSFWQRSS